MKLFGMTFFEKQSEPESTAIKVEDLQAAANNFYGPTQDYRDWYGEKFPGGLGDIEILLTDYWALRRYSAHLFKKNLYAKGLIRRLITNEINTGLCVESTPISEILGMPEESLEDWSEDIEQRFDLWAKNIEICDWEGENTFYKLQAIARQEALIEGDVLVVLRQNAATKMPSVQIISGQLIQDPYMSDYKLPDGYTITQGVERDARKRHVAYWITDEEGNQKRLLARGSRSGRRQAWLVYGTDKRKDEVRGEPLLSIILQSLQEIDRYRDAVQRKAVLNSILAMFIKKTKDKPSTLPVTGGAVARSTVDITDCDGRQRKFNLGAQIPGVVFEELQEGEEPVGFSNQGVNTEFGTFEHAMLQAIAWANEIPPEILMLAFSNNYSASQAAINEFKIYLNRKRQDIGTTMCQPVYVEWLLNEAMARRIKAQALLEDWRNPMRFEQFGAWTCADWSGAIKPSTDILKQANGYTKQVGQGFITRGRAARELNGMKYSRIVKQLKKENKELAEALRPLLELKQKFGEKEVNQVMEAVGGSFDIDAIAERTLELLAEDTDNIRKVA